MKYLLIFLALVLTGGAVKAQNYWQGSGATFEYETKSMYYDSTEEKSYIFGSFKTFNGDSANIVVYDGNTYDTLPKAPIWSIWSMARYKGKLYAAGYYAGLAVWDGITWSIIEQDGVFFNLKVFDDKLYTMGNFNKIGNLNCRGIAVWNDTSWADFLGIDSIISAGQFINDLIFYKGKTYVCGNFYNPAYPHLEDIMLHNGQSWQAVGDFSTDGLGDVRKLLIWRDTLYIAGLISEAGNAPGNGVAAWDGQRWHRLQDGLKQMGGATVTDLIVYNNELWACGYFSVINNRYVAETYGGLAKWDGTQWCSMGMRRLGLIHHFGRWKDELFIVGEFGLLNNPNISRVAKWIGGNYTDTCNQYFTVNIPSRDNNTSLLQVYPNPAMDQISIKLPDEPLPAQKNITITLTNACGQSIPLKQKAFYFYPGKIEIDISPLPAGIYFIQLQGKNINGNSRFVKTK